MQKRAPSARKDPVVPSGRVRRFIEGWFGLSALSKNISENHYAQMGQVAPHNATAYVCYAPESNMGPAHLIDGALYTLAVGIELTSSAQAFIDCACNSRRIALKL